MFRNIISKMFNGGGTMKISKKNLLAFARNHTYGEEMAKGCRSKETTLHTSVYLNYGIITERFLINGRVIKEKNHGEETENV